MIAAFGKRLQSVAACRVQLLCLLLYSMQILGRRSFALAVSPLFSSGTLSRSQIGILSSVWRISLATTKIGITLFIDEFDPRVLMGISWIGSGVCCILVGLSNSFWLMVVPWACDAAFVSTGWPSTVKFLRSGCDAGGGLGTWMSVYAACASLAAGTFPWIFAAVTTELEMTEREQARFSFVLPGMVSILAGLLAFRQFGHLRASTHRNGGESAANDSSGNQSGAKPREVRSEIQNYGFVQRVSFFVRTPGFVYFLLAITVVNGIKILLIDWFVLLAMETGMADEKSSQAGLGWLDVGVMLGTLSSGVLAAGVPVLLRRVFAAEAETSQSEERRDLHGNAQYSQREKQQQQHHHRSMSMVTVSYSLGAVLIINHIVDLMASSHDEPAAHLPLVMGMLGFTLGGLHNLLVLAAVSVWPPHLVGAAMGLSGLSAQLGALLAGWPVAYAVSTFGGWMPIARCVQAAGLLLVGAVISAFASSSVA
ncbi:probable hexose phosphate transport protein [Sycon ciliatum]|uniref:probable hexose phosphate transport protein n=1 Tax=Sycon ciliatum TaxID=27933 RepID=UPI0031F71547|eukprot:scpid82284/ scgid19834/ Probable hexose phosphate transport protein